MENTPISPTPGPLPPGSTPPPPPPYLPPPPVISAPASRPRSHTGWIVTTVVLGVLLLFCLAALVSRSVTHRFTGMRPHGEAFGSAREAGPKLDEYLLEDNSSADNKIAVISIEGIISSHDFDSGGNNMVDLVIAQLDQARNDKKVKAVLLKMDSPGGEVLASDEIYKAIRNFQEDSKKPVVCSMGSLAASGGYYISSGCRWIVANELTLTGSIGVIMHGWNYRGLMDKIGVAPMTYKSGKFKDMLSGERSAAEIPPEEHQMVQDLIDQTFQKFKDVVADGRGAAHALNKKSGKPLADNWEDYADGRVVSGKQALDLGLVDELGDFDDSVNRAEQLVHLDKANLIEYRQHYDLANLLSMFGQSSQVHDIKLQLGVEPPQLRAGLLYYLAPTFVN